MKRKNIEYEYTLERENRDITDPNFKASNPHIQIIIDKVRAGWSYSRVKNKKFKGLYMAPVIYKNLTDLLRRIGLSPYTPIHYKINRELNKGLRIYKYKGWIIKKIPVKHRKQK